jgi:hypothetical protein
MSNPDTKLLEKYFSHFAKNFRMSNLYAKLLEMLAMFCDFLCLFELMLIFFLGGDFAENSENQPMPVFQTCSN